ncbi:MAG: polyprenyl synthetase family protein [Spirochaetota bacterium]
MLVDSIINKLKTKIDEEVQNFLNKDYKIPLKYPELESFYKETVNYSLRKGKRIRPVLFILGAFLYSENEDIETLYYDNNIIKSSIFLELLQAFFLCHDDIIDNSDLRRGKKSLHIILNDIFGDKTNYDAGLDKDKGKLFAILSGDILFALSSKALNNIAIDNINLKNKIQDTFYNYVLDTTIGQFLDMHNGYKNLDDLLEDGEFYNKVKSTYILKTAKYTIETPLILGANYRGLVEEEENKLKTFASKLGFAFQLQDDLIGLFGSIKEIGKPVTSDILEEKKTLLILDTYYNLNKEGRSKFKKLFYERPLTDESFNKIKDYVKNSGAKSTTINKLEQNLNEALEIVNTLNISDYKKQLLKEFSKKMLSKYH